MFASIFGLPSTQITKENKNCHSFDSSVSDMRMTIPTRGLHTNLLFTARHDNGILNTHRCTITGVKIYQRRVCRKFLKEDVRGYVSQTIRSLVFPLGLGYSKYSATRAVDKNYEKLHRRNTLWPPTLISPRALD